MTEATIESVRDLPLWWQVTRYDPARRDADGAYPDDDWVERADIGRTFGGEVLTEATYLRVEESYLTCVREAADELGVSVFELRGIERLPAVFRSAKRLAVSDAIPLLRLIIRGEAWCRLESPDNRFAVHMVSSLYLYLGAAEKPEMTFRRAEDRGLFVEVLDGGSPCSPENDPPMSLDAATSAEIRMLRDSVPEWEAAFQWRLAEERGDLGIIQAVSVLAEWVGAQLDAHTNDEAIARAFAAIEQLVTEHSFCGDSLGAEFIEVLLLRSDALARMGPETRRRADGLLERTNRRRRVR